MHSLQKKCSEGRGREREDRKGSDGKERKSSRETYPASTMCYFLGSKLSEQFTLGAFDFILYLCIYLSTMSQREKNFREGNKHC